MVPPNVALKSAAKGRNFLIEPLIFLFYCGNSFFENSLTTGLYWKICRQSYGDNSLCDNLKLNPLIETQVQRDSATFKTYLSVCNTLPIVLAGPIIGALSDKYGRKNILLCALTTALLYQTTFVFELVFVQLPLFIFPLIGFITAFGGHGMVLASCFAYVADNISDEKTITLRYSFIYALKNIAQIGSDALSGFMLEEYRFQQVILVNLGVLACCFFYVLLFLEQKPPPISRKEIVADIMPEKRKLTETEPLLAPDEDEINKNILENLTREYSQVVYENGKGVLRSVYTLYKSAIHTLIKKRQKPHTRIYLWLTIIVFVILEACQVGQILTLFCLGSPLFWSASKISFFRSFHAAALLVGNLFCSFVLKTWLRFRETTLLMISILSLVGYQLLVGLSEESVQMYVAAMVGCAVDINNPVAKSLASQFVESDEVGKLYALFHLANDLTTLVSQPLLNGVYAATVALHPGFVLFLMAGLSLPTIFLICWIHFDRKKSYFGAV